MVAIVSVLYGKYVDHTRRQVEVCFDGSGTNAEEETPRESIKYGRTCFLISTCRGRPALTYLYICLYLRTMNIVDSVVFDLL